MADLAAKYREVGQYIRQRGDVKVTELTRDFYLSEATVRRVLTAFEEDGLIRRYHGGATLIDPESLSSVNRRKISGTDQKQAIGELAASFVSDGMTLLMLGGTTVQATCPYLDQKKLTVITNSLPVVNALNWKQNIMLVVLGGILNATELEMRGPLTEHSLGRLRADVMLVGATGLHIAHGLMTDDANSVSTYSRCIDISDQVYALADSSKFTHPTGMLKVAKLSELTGIVTDDLLPLHINAEYGHAGITLHTARTGGTAP